MKEIYELESKDISVRNRILISEACPLVLSYHVAMDIAREKERDVKALGTTGCGIGLVYEDKAARRELCVGDLFNKKPS